jgi:hypothetical protein
VTVRRKTCMFKVCTAYYATSVIEVKRLSHIRTPQCEYPLWVHCLYTPMHNADHAACLRFRTGNCAYKMDLLDYLERYITPSMKRKFGKANVKPHELNVRRISRAR